MHLILSCVRDTWTVKTSTRTRRERRASQTCACVERRCTCAPDVRKKEVEVHICGKRDTKGFPRIWIEEELLVFRLRLEKIRFQKIKFANNCADPTPVHCHNLLKTVDYIYSFRFERKKSIFVPLGKDLTLSCLIYLTRL